MRGALAPHVHMLGRTVDNRRSAGRRPDNRVEKRNAGRSGTTSFSPRSRSEEAKQLESTQRLPQVQPAKQGIGEVSRNLPTCAQPVKPKLEMPFETFFTTPTLPQVNFFPAATRHPGLSDYRPLFLPGFSHLQFSKGDQALQILQGIRRVALKHDSRLVPKLL